MPDRTLIRRLRLASLLEGFTLLLLLFVAVPAKHLFGHPMAVRVIGSVHGLCFLLFLWSLVAAVSAGGWSRGEIFRILLGSFLPFGVFVNAPLLKRKELIPEVSELGEEER
ncbi:hypothetical protein MAMC_00060 [Methylacidimicrobium cyclopophantes]|uniref:DUF3817 domain-containing protein n=1 Tax=Methylacidimicrobium cyclopophantes TaxID=1041766 RepID=A0A5E6MEF8_9BACT|nr:DUF3817 domain-containing protein [Methylacidimicrobium cyclopophantes]VVM04445.1 hypothetical protein MAMC_00060 [Methylacidimicrobium cyclopophantes]